MLKQRNISHKGFDALLNFTQNIKSIIHTDMQYSEVYGEGLDTPITARGNYLNDISALLQYYREKVGDHSVVTDVNPFQGRNGVDLNAGDYRLRKPWVFLRAVSLGRSAPFGQASAMSWQDHFKSYLKLMYPF